MEVSALRYSGGIGLHARSPLLRLQSDERLISLVRRGNASAFEMLVSRYQSRLLAFCRHLLGSREDAEDVLQEVFTAAYNAMVADDRAINVRPWLYRIARNRCLNHLRRIQPVGVDSMDVHFSDYGASTADKVHMAEEFRLLVGDIQGLPETQRTALVLREMDALSYDQIAEAMETTVPSVKSLLVRARLSLAEAAESRMLTCDTVRMELAEVAEGLLPKASAPVRRHLRSCQRCSGFHNELKRTSRVLAALLPLGPVALLKSLAVAHLGHSAGAAGSASAGSGAAGGASAAAGGAAAGGAGVAAGGAIIGAGASNFIPLGLGAIATKTAAGLAAAALVTAGAVDMSHQAPRRIGSPHIQGALTPSAADAAVAEVAQAPTIVMRAADPYAAAAPAVHHLLHATLLVHRHTKKAAKKTTATTGAADAKTAAKSTDVGTAAKSTDVKTAATKAAQKKKAAAADAHKTPVSTTPPTSDGAHPQLTTSSDNATEQNNQLTSPTPAPVPANSSPDASGSGSRGSTTASSGTSSTTSTTTTSGSGSSTGGSSTGGTSTGGSSSSTGPSGSQSPPTASGPASPQPITTTVGNAGDTTVTVPVPAPPTGP